MKPTAILERPRPADEDVRIPLDLSAWVPTARLREWIMTEVATLDWTNAELLELLRKDPDFEPKALLNTMIFAYAMGIFTAEEIARRCSEDIEFRGVRPRLPPRVDELKRFRKENQVVLKWGLAKVIGRAFKSQLIEGDEIARLPPGLQRYVMDDAVQRLNLARYLDRSVDQL